MFIQRTPNNKINRLHEKALRSIFGDCKSEFDELLKKDGSFSFQYWSQKYSNVNYRNIQIFQWTAPANNELSLPGQIVSLILSEG